jgi:hypothetical protein
MKNVAFRYGVLSWMMGFASAPGCAHAKIRGSPMITGTARIATTGSIRLPASNTRRATMPHCPPERCCSIRRASDPSDRLRQKRKPISHERKN